METKSDELKDSEGSIFRKPLIAALGAAGIAAGVVALRNYLRKQAEGEREFLRSLRGRFEKRERSYLYVPSKAAFGAESVSDRPLLVALHGCMQTAFKMAQGTRLNQLAERENFLVLYPAQRWPRHIQNCWKWYKSENQKRDSGELAEIMAMIREVQAQYPIDSKRIFVTGLSSGAGVAASLLACYPEVFSGGVLHSGPAYASAQGLIEGMRVQLLGPASKRKPYPSVADPSRFQGDLLVVQGTKDKTVHPSHAERLIEQFVPMEERALHATVRVSNPNTRGLVGRLTLYGPRAEADGRSRVAKLEIEGLGHAWSGGDDLVPFNDFKGPDLSAAVVNFLIEKRLPFTMRGGEAVAARETWERGLELSPA